MSRNYPHFYPYPMPLYPMYPINYYYVVVMNSDYDSSSDSEDLDSDEEPFELNIDPVPIVQTPSQSCKLNGKQKPKVDNKQQKVKSNLIKKDSNQKKSNVKHNQPSKAKTQNNQKPKVKNEDKPKEDLKFIIQGNQNQTKKKITLPAKKDKFQLPTPNQLTQNQVFNQQFNIKPPFTDKQNDDTSSSDSENAQPSIQDELNIDNEEFNHSSDSSESIPFNIQQFDCSSVLSQSSKQIIISTQQNKIPSSEESSSEDISSSDEQTDLDNKFIISRPPGFDDNDEM